MTHLLSYTTLRSSLLSFFAHISNLIKLNSSFGITSFKTSFCNFKLDQTQLMYTHYNSAALDFLINTNVNVVKLHTILEHMNVFHLEGCIFCRTSKCNNLKFWLKILCFAASLLL